MEITEEVVPAELTKDEIASLLALKSSLGNEDINIATLSDKIEPNIKTLFDDTVNKFTSFGSKYNTDLIKSKIDSLLSKETILNPDNTRESTHAVYTLANRINNIIKKIVSVCDAEGNDNSSFVLLSNPDINQQVVVDGSIVNIRDLTPTEIVKNPDIDDELKELMTILISNNIATQRDINRFIHYLSARQHNMYDYELNIPATTPTLDIIISIYANIHQVLDFLYSNVKELAESLRFVPKQRTKLINNVYLPMYEAGSRMFKDNFIN